jgi:hypothetical protein
MGTGALATLQIVLPLVLMILKDLPGLVQNAEEAFGSLKGSGPQKKLFVLDLIDKVLTVAKAAEPKLGKILTPELTATITQTAGAATDSAVAVLNATAWKDVQPPAAAAAEPGVAAAPGVTTSKVSVP